MKNPRKYGKPPFNIAVIHGGPGAPGEMAPLAREISSSRGVLEPLQTASSLEGQIQELNEILKVSGDLPITLIGWSWGAILGFIFTASYPLMIKKLILVGSAVFEEKYALKIMETRLSRLNEKEKTEILAIIETLNNTVFKDKNILMSRLGKLFFKADSYNPLPYKSEVLEYQYHIFRSVWEDAEKLRASGELLELGRNIQCPVVAVHGDYDPHPYRGIQKPLSHVIKDFRFILLKNCGHYPWIERMAKDSFYHILKKELNFKK